MLFNFFGNKEDTTPEDIFVDKAFINTTSKINACIARAKEQPNTIFICWFANTLNAFKAAFALHHLDELKIVDAHQIHSGMLQNKIPVFTEHHPLHAKEIELVHNWPTKNIIVYSTMGEPLFKHFGSEKMLPLLKLLGFKEDEAIEHPLVSKSIIKGQSKIAAAVSIEQLANSQAEWLKRNLINEA